MFSSNRLHPLHAWITNLKLHDNSCSKHITYPHTWDDWRVVTSPLRTYAEAHTVGVSDGHAQHHQHVVLLEVGGDGEHGVGGAGDAGTSEEHGPGLHLSANHGEGSVVLVGELDGSSVFGALTLYKETVEI